MDKMNQNLRNRIQNYSHKDVQTAIKYSDMIKQPEARKDILRYYIRKFENDLGSPSKHPLLKMNKTVCNSLRVVNPENIISECDIVSGFVGTNGKINVKRIEGVNLVDAKLVKSDYIECDILNADVVITKEKPKTKISDCGKIIIEE